GRSSRAVTGTCLLPPASVASWPRSTLGGPGRGPWANRAQALRSQVWTVPGDAAPGLHPLRPPGQPPPKRRGPGKTKGRRRVRGAHLLDGGFAAAPEPHKQDPRLGAVSAARAAATAGPRASAATRRCLLFLLLHAVAEVLGERVGCAVTAGQGRLLRPVLQGHGAGPPPPAP
uniref:Uncharacterized protein n=1 Tax=Mus spicilegus TaxID=10103 RepID=A0A8C6H9E1_MUSSI